MVLPTESTELAMSTPVWSRYPLVSADTQGRSWLTLLNNLQRSPATVDAYGRGLNQYLRFCQDFGVDATSATLEHVSLFVRQLSGDIDGAPVQRVSNATLQQRLTAIRLWYDHLVYQRLRERNPVPRGRRLFAGGAERDHTGFQYGLVRQLALLPCIPSEADWARVLAEVAREGLRNRLMFALAYYGALRREELVSLCVSDLDVAHRLVTIRAETSKSSRSRVVCYSAATAPALALYLNRRRTLDMRAGPIFLSESDRNPRQPLSKWSWSKVIERLARQAAVTGFSTHTLRHLRLTHLARSGWRLHDIATYAGHRNVQTSAQYIHLSGNDLLTKMAQSVDYLNAKIGAAFLGEP